MASTGQTFRLDFVVSVFVGALQWRSLLILGLYPLPLSFQEISQQPSPQVLPYLYIDQLVHFIKVFVQIEND